MLKLHRWIMISIILAITTTSHGNEYKGYKKLNPDECIPLDKGVVVSQLPTEWHKYVGFIKICKLTPGKATTTQVSIISIWAHDYLNTQPPDTPWEKFPLPIIIDSSFKQIGHINELYPSDWVTDLNIYYGQWQFDVPTEIRVDVENPAVSGDYYYAPLIWNKKNGFYEMRTKETINGRRPR